MNLQEIRQKYPQYSSIPDQQLADAFYSKFYADKMDKGQFYNAIGMKDSGNEMMPAITSNKSSAEDAAKREQLENMLGIRRTPVDTLRDIAGGVMYGAQNIAALLGEGGQGLASLLTGGHAPTVDIREEMGLGKNIPVDLRKIIGSSRPSMATPILQGAGQYAPAIIAGGASIPGQMVANGLFGMTQAAPDETNLGGLLPSGRIGRGIEDAALTGILGRTGQEVLSGFPVTRNIINKFRPGAASEELMQHLNGMGGITNSETNAERIANTINTSAEMQKANALAHKQNVMEQVGGTKINEVPASQLPEGNLDKVGKIIGVNPAEMEPIQVADLSKAIKRYRRHGDFDTFMDNVEDIFHKEGLTPKQEDLLDTAMSVPVNKDLKYLSSDNAKNISRYNGDLKDVHEEFMRNPTFENAHKLESQLEAENRYYRKLYNQGKLDQAGNLDWRAVKRSRAALSDDMKNVLSGLPEDLQSEWQQFKTKYRQNYAPYESTTPLAQISKGNTQGTRPETIRAIFSYPNRNVQKILGDLPQETRNNILYNELTHLDVNEPEQIANFIDNLEQDKGYAKYITPEIKQYRDAIKSRLKNKARLVNIGSLGVVPAGKNVIKTLQSIFKGK